MSSVTGSGKGSAQQTANVATSYLGAGWLPQLPAAVAALRASIDPTPAGSATAAVAREGGRRPETAAAARG